MARFLFIIAASQHAVDFVQSEAFLCRMLPGTDLCEKTEKFYYGTCPLGTFSLQKPRQWPDKFSLSFVFFYDRIQAAISCLKALDAPPPPLHHHLVCQYVRSFQYFASCKWNCELPSEKVLPDELKCVVFLNLGDGRYVKHLTCALFALQYANSLDVECKKHRCDLESDREEFRVTGEYMGSWFLVLGKSKVTSSRLDNCRLLMLAGEICVLLCQRCQILLKPPLPFLLDNRWTAKNTKEMLNLGYSLTDPPIH